jgi:hypothetical protein
MEVFPIERSRINRRVIQGLTNRWSQPLADVKSTFDFMKAFSEFAALAPTSGGSAPVSLDDTIVIGVSS